MTDERELTEDEYRTIFSDVPMKYFKSYDRQGNEIDIARYMFLHEDLDYCRVAEETIGDVWVSTVWLGSGISIMGEPPRIFETMTFSEREDWANQSWQYTTEKEAVMGHFWVCAIVRGEGREIMP